MWKNAKFIELSAEAWEDSRKKNQLIWESKERYLFFVNKDLVDVNELAEVLAENGLLQREQVVAVCAAGLQEWSRISLAELLMCAPMEIVAFAFDRELLALSGSFHEKLKGYTNYELLARLVKAAGGGIVIPLAGQVECQICEEEIFACGYLFRNFLGDLHKEGCTEEVFQQMCANMAQKGCLEVFRRVVEALISNETYYECMARNTAPFVVLQGDATCYGVLSDFALRIKEALLELGQAVIAVDEKFHSYEELPKVCKGIIGFQAHALEIAFFRELHGPKMQFWFDDPVHFRQVLRELPEDFYIFCQDDNHAKFIREYYHSPGAMQFPPGGSVSVRGDFQGTYDVDVMPMAEQRPYDIVFVGSYLETRQDAFSEEEAAFYDYMMEHSELTFAEGICRLWEMEGKDCSRNREKVWERLREMRRVCNAVVGAYRIRVVEQILAAGYQIHVYGETWQQYKGPFAAGLVRHEQVTPEKSLGELQKAKIGLNVMRWHKGGMTERVANIMLSGAVCLSDESAYLKEHFREGEEMVLFKLDALDALPGLVQRLLEDEDYRTDVARNAYKKALSEHTWQRRAIQMLEFLEEKEEKSYFSSKVFPKSSDILNK